MFKCGHRGAATFMTLSPVDQDGSRALRQGRRVMAMCQVNKPEIDNGAFDIDVKPS